MCTTGTNQLFSLFFQSIMSLLSKKQIIISPVGNSDLAKRAATCLLDSVQKWVQHVVEPSHCPKFTLSADPLPAADADNNAAAAAAGGGGGKKKKGGAAPAPCLVAVQFAGDAAAAAADKKKPATSSSGSSASAAVLATLHQLITNQGALPTNGKDSNDSTQQQNESVARFTELLDCLATEQALGNEGVPAAMAGVFRLCKTLSTRTWFLGHRPSLADAVCYSLVKDRVAGWPTAQQVQQAGNLVRWLNTMQHSAPWLAASDQDLLDLPLDVPAELIRKPDQDKQKKVVKTDKNLVGGAQKQQKQQKQKGGGGGAAGAAAAGTTTPLFARLDIRCGKIVKCEKHPNAETLYVETIDTGDEEPRTIISGLVNHVPLDQMQNRMVCVVCNLKPRKMQGIVSQGMVLCASNGTTVEVLDPHPAAKPGARLLPAGMEPSPPDAKVDAQKKNNAWTPVVPDLRVNADGIACYQDTPLVFDQTADAHLTAPTIRNANIS